MFFVYCDLVEYLCVFVGLLVMRLLLMKLLSCFAFSFHAVIKIKEIIIISCVSLANRHFHIVLRVSGFFPDTFTSSFNPKPIHAELMDDCETSVWLALSVTVDDHGFVLCLQAVSHKQSP